MIKIDSERCFGCAICVGECHLKNLKFDAGLAAMNMELVACAGGLGVLYSSFITRGADNKQNKKIFGVPDGKKVFMAMLVGHPSVRFKRSAPRRKADVIWS